MKFRIFTRIIIVVLFLNSLLGFAQTSQKSLGRVNFVLGSPGDVKIQPDGKKYWFNARINSAVYNGDCFRTQSESRCEIKLKNNGIIRIGENADFTLRESGTDGRNNSELRSGSLWANIKQLFSKNKFQVKTPTAVCSIRGTIYRIDADSSTKVCVYKGAVDVGPAWMADDDSTRSARPEQYQQPHEVPGPTEVPGPFEVTLDQWVRIVAGYQIEINQQGKYHKSKIDEQADKENDWVKWNKLRDGVE